MTATRALGLVRLSRTADPASTSIERQHEIIETYTAQQDMTLVGFAEDKATSAFKIPPEKRPQIRSWLDRPDEYDCLVYWRQDRLVRRTADFMGIVTWCKANGKKLYSATEAIGDVTEHAGVLLGFITAWQGEGESLNTSARVKQNKAYLRRNGRWPGGKPSYGYRAERDDIGWRLVVDDGGSAEVIREVIRSVIAGESVNAVVADLNARHVPSPRDHLRLAKGIPVDKPSPWIGRSARVILRSPALLGQVIHDGKVQRGDDGLPVRWAEPIISPADWDALQTALDGAARAKRRTQTPSFVLGVGFCGRCDSPLYRWSKPNPKGVTYSYYKCARTYNKASRYEPCSSKPIKCETLDEIINDMIIDEYGDYPHGERKVTKANDREAKLADLGVSMAELTQDQFVRGNPRDDYDAMMAKLRTEHERVSAQPPEPARVDWVPSGMTVAGYWQSLSQTERRLFLVRHGVKVYAHRADDGLAVTGEGGELFEMLQALTDTDYLAEMTALGDAASSLAAELAAGRVTMADLDRQAGDAQRAKSG